MLRPRRHLADHLVKPLEYLSRAVGVDRPQTARVPSVPRLQHGQGRRSFADFADDDPVGAQPHLRLDDVVHRDDRVHLAR